MRTAGCEARRGPVPRACALSEANTAMLTSYTLRAQREAERKGDQSIARAPDPEPARAPDPEPARARNAEELEALLATSNARIEVLEAELVQAGQFLNELPARLEEEISQRVAAAKTELSAKLSAAEARCAELATENAQIAAIANTNATELASAHASARTLRAELDAASSRIAELEAPPEAPVADEPEPAPESASPRRRR